MRGRLDSAARVPLALSLGSRQGAEGAKGREEGQRPMDLGRSELARECARIADRLFREFRQAAGASYQSLQARTVV